MKTALVYYSMGGNTQQTAEKIAEKTGAELIRIEPVKQYPDKGMRKFIWGGMKTVMGEKPRLQPYRFDSDYERIIIGTPVWASNMAPPIRTFIHENRDAIMGKEIAAFVCFAGGGGDKALERLRQALGINAFSAEMMLIDPKDNPTQENEEKINSFCEQIK